MTPPGWYTDPRNAALLRWWNGHHWTDQTKTGGAPPPLPHVATINHAVNAGQAFAAAATPSALHAVAEQIRAAELRLNYLRGELESVEEALEIQSFGFYRPKYGFPTSSEYDDHLHAVRQKQEMLIKTDQATHCSVEWRVEGSLVEGRKMVKRMSKLMLRAFNGECDAAIAKTRYDNVLKLEQRIRKSCQDINKLGESNQIFINLAYFELKVAELHLVHEHREKVWEEKEEQKRIREQMRDDERAREEIAKVQAKAEKDEAHTQRALDKARVELQKAVSDGAAAASAQHSKLEALIAKLENELKEAIDRKAKAIARAQLTKSGWVYVLSNVGSFGEGIYKIGLTRRFDPQERVDELGDASVPFTFDVHAIIFSEDAPSLEAALHREFASKRVNMVNNRKEYFRVSIEDIEAAVKRHHGLVTLVKDCEAEEFRKTQALLNAQMPDPS